MPVIGLGQTLDRGGVLLTARHQDCYKGSAWFEFILTLVHREEALQIEEMQKVQGFMSKCFEFAKIQM